MRDRPKIALVALLACALASASTVAPAARADEDAAAPIYRSDAIVAVDLQLPPASVEALEDDPTGDYVEGTFSLAPTDGTPGGEGTASGSLTVGIRLKGGAGSFRELKDEKAAFKIKFNEFVKGQKFLGLKKLTLNNMVQDPSMLHETLTYEAFRLLGIPSPRTGYAYVRVNGEGFGVYLNVETYDDISLPRWFASTRHLYEADAPGVDVSPGGAGEFEVDEGDDADLADLEALIVAADGNMGDWSDGMAAVADLGEMARMWAVERYAGHWDGYAGIDAPFRPNNYYLHDEDGGVGAGVFQMLPWGTDQTWEVPVEFDEPAGGLLFNHCIADASCLALYVDALRDLRASIGALQLDSQATCLAQRLAPWQALEDEGRREYDAGEIEAGVEEVREFVARRDQDLAEWLVTQPPQAGEPHAAELPAACRPPEREPDAKGTATTADASSGSAEAAAQLRLGRSWVSGDALRTRVWLSASGSIEETAKLGSGPWGIRACEADARLRRAGRATLHCPLEPVARRRLQARGRNLTVTVRFVPQTGAPISARREVFVPRQPSD